LNTKFKTLLIAAAGVFLVFAIVVYSKYFTNNTKGVAKEMYVEIPTGSDFNKVLQLVSPYIENIDNFKFIAGVRSYEDNVKPGRFLLKEGMSSFGLVSALRRNMPVNLAFNNQERLENLCVRIRT
jgi:UPF0755 protein